MRLNAYSVKALQHRTTRYEVWDDQLPRFGVRVGTRRKTFIINIGKSRRAVGVYPLTTLQEARDEAKRRLFAKYLPAPAIYASKAAEDFLRATDGQRKPGTNRVYSIYLRNLPNKPLSELTPKLLYDALPEGKGSGNLCFNVFKAFLSWCVERGYLENNCLLKRRQPNKLKSRDRLLTDKEIKLIWQTSYHHQNFGALVRLLILTGQRLNQVASFETQWVTPATIQFPADVMKSNSEHTIPLTDFVRQHLPAESFTGSISDARKRLQAALPQVPHWTPHDFRRYFSSTMAKLGTPIEVTERLLAHKTGSISQIAQVYNRHSYLPEMRSALERYENHLFSLLERTE